jgi:hypothetical protein
VKPVRRVLAIERHPPGSSDVSSNGQIVEAIRRAKREQSSADVLPGKFVDEGSDGEKARQADECAAVLDRAVDPNPQPITV